MIRVELREDVMSPHLTVYFIVAGMFVRATKDGAK